MGAGESGQGAPGEQGLSETELDEDESAGAGTDETDEGQAARPGVTR